MNQVCAQCGAVGFHQPGCGLGQVSAPLQQAAQSSAMIQAGVGNLEAGVGGIQAGVQAGFGAVQHQLALGNVLAAASLGLQRQQLGVQVRQLGHLQSIDAAIARMANYQERQAALTQVLFELQQKGAFVTELARTDAFSAGIYGRLYVEGVTGAGITVEAFDKLEYKHEFAAVIGRLRAAWTPFALRPDMARRAGAFLAAAREAASWQNVHVPDEGQVHGMFAQAEHARAERDRQAPDTEQRRKQRSERLYENLKKLGISLVTCVVLALALAVLGGGDTAIALNALLWVLALLILVAIGALIVVDVTSEEPVRRGPDPDDLERQAFAMKEVLGRYRAFVSRPDGARLVDEVLRAHPALRQQ